MSARVLRALLGALLASIAFAAAAQADVSGSSNWAGYAVHRSGVRFNRVIGAWRQPSVTCVRGRTSYSAMWIGLGGYSGTSDALEQIGTEADCTASGRQASGAWYEMVPAPSRGISMRVRPGDAMFATVAVSGRTTTLTLADGTRHERASRRIQRSDLDVTSAEWIVEAPSECTASGACQTLPLANFGQAVFGLAGTRSSQGHIGTIADRGWGTTRIVLQTGGGRRFVGSQAPPTIATAVPSTLTIGGSAFAVNYANGPVSGPFAAREARAVRTFPGARRGG